MLINIVLWLVLGAIAGYVASLIIGNSKSQSRLMDIIIGIAGAVIGGFIVSPFLDVGKFSLMGLIVAIGGATLLLFLKGKFLK